MANEPVDMIMPMLREMRSEMNDRFSQIDRHIGDVEDELKSVRKMLVADTLMSKLATGDFEKRISALEIDVQRLMRET